MKEVITICIGGAGVRIGEKFWELACLEHGIGPDGARVPPSGDDSGDSLSTFFSSREGSNRWVPRTVFVDTELSAIDEVRTGASRRLFHPEYLVATKLNTGGSFARGYQRAGDDLLDQVLDRVRRLADTCSSLEGFVVIHSLGGGTGSGLTARVMERLSAEFQDKTKVLFAVLSSGNLAVSPVEPYNAVLCMGKILEHSDCCFIIDNEAVFDIARRNLDVSRPSYVSLNRLIAYAISSITAGMRFGGELYPELRDIPRNLVPRKGLHFPLLSCAPIMSAVRDDQAQLSTAQMTAALFEPESLFLRADPLAGKHMACSLLYRGDVKPTEANAAIKSIREGQGGDFVDGTPADIKSQIISAPPVVVPGGDMRPVSRSALMLSNTTAITGVWERLSHKFDLLFGKRAFVHWYSNEGMEVGELTEARESLGALMRHYEEAGQG